MSSQLTNTHNNVASSNHRSVHKSYLFCLIYKLYKDGIFYEYFKQLFLHKKTIQALATVTWEQVTNTDKTNKKLNLFNYYRQYCTTDLYKCTCNLDLTV